MKKWLTGFFMCQSMFCAIPCPVKLWDENCRTKMLLCLPLLGLELGAVWYGCALLCFRLGVPAAVRGFLIGCAMFFLTGGIHLDGFMDVSDAVGSYASTERRREILKDSHVGSFAVIHVALLIAAAIAFGAGLERLSGCLIFIPAVSRGCSAAAVLTLKPMHTSQYSAISRGSSAVFAQIAVGLTVIVGFVLCKVQAFSLIAVIAAYCLALSKAYRALQGMNGDISGYAQSISEICGLAALVFLQGV